VAGPGPLPIVASRMGHLWDALCRAYQLLGFDQAAGRDGVFRDLVLARTIRAGQQLLTAEDPLPADLREALALIR